ncbi:Fe-S cluster assembly sulfur transfer protein SufU [Pollutimonas harenae]|uniref:SUF system NifU family Fe-S cluster assembly protein n=1 Tax=Pollutimonas harenae TaxID=657015 RepID=A0A853GS39_9BURK|nr:SUF system NifU family Fe-S cluster assembly protein [Pollutimonas harenae]NYT85918.1 SUF system NifU family Fe-S cluster assembly protein [Pollutimonas harenae]TEA70970.1 SUF system NifU family Fe-S cluster assembly protein [Pollutimonas harenae]
MSDQYSDLRELYQEVIFDHNRHPRNFHAMDDASHRADGHNPLCGDQLTVYARVKNDLVEEVSFVGHGCAISTASASLMTEAVKGKSISDVEALFEDMHAMLTEKHPEARDFGKLEVLSGVREFPARVKCATLAWHTLHNAITQARDTARTE